jgi:hypothetical protein
MKPLDSFGKRTSVPDGRTSWCKACRSTDRRYYANRRKATHRVEYLKYDRDRQRRNIRRMRTDLLTMYGSKCECCGVGHAVFLCIDHVYGDGAEERAVLKGYGVYRKLLKAGVRLPGYRILCFNCNFAMGLYGFCPHNNLPSQPSRYERRMNRNPPVQPIDSEHQNRDEPADLPPPTN